MDGARIGGFQVAVVGLVLGVWFGVGGGGRFGGESWEGWGE